MMPENPVSTICQNQLAEFQQYFDRLAVEAGSCSCMVKSKGSTNWQNHAPNQFQEAVRNGLAASQPHVELLVRKELESTLARMKLRAKEEALANAKTLGEP